MRTILLAVTAAVGISGNAFAGAQPFIGEILTFASNFCPVGYLPTDGRLLPINTNTALFSLLGITYGGDGVSTFRLPNTKPNYTRSRALLMQCIAVYGIYPPHP